MSHRQKVEHLITELGQQGVGAYTAAPPLFRLFWALGLKVPPPLFLGFGKLTLLMGASFGVLWGVLWGVLMWLWVWQGEIPAVIAVPLIVIAAVLAGLIFGVVMAGLIRRKAAQLGIPSSWEDYPQA
jgi:membrane associated rhomboid family serine protease